MIKKLKALIVDDEENARILLCKLLEEILLFKDIRTADSADSAFGELSNFDPDIIFLDIKMPGKDGFAFIQGLPEKLRSRKIVFVTAYDQYAIKAIKSQAFDYLLKPVDRKELKHCIQRVIEKSEEIITDKKESRKEITRIRVNTRNGTLFINPDNILYCKAEGNYTVVCTGKRRHLCSMNLGKLASFLPASGFIRVGRSYIINFEYVTLLDRKECTIVLARESESATIKVAKQHLKNLDQL